MFTFNICFMDGRAARGRGRGRSGRGGRIARRGARPPAAAPHRASILSEIQRAAITRSLDQNLPPAIDAVVRRAVMAAQEQPGPSGQPMPMQGEAIQKELHAAIFFPILQDKLIWHALTAALQGDRSIPNQEQVAPEFQPARSAP